MVLKPYPGGFLLQHVVRYIIFPETVGNKSIKTDQFGDQVDIRHEEINVDDKDLTSENMKTEGKG